MNFQNFKFPALAVTLLWGTCQIRAQSVAMEYNTELQTDFRGGYNWLNLLRLSTSVSLNEAFSFEGATLSIANTHGETLINDLQGYSNIEASNLPLAIAVLGFQYNVSRSTFFLGIRNVNEDYFVSPVTSFFLNSSCGIFPTLSCNYDIANYPLSGWCLHYSVQWEKIQLQSSLYEGRGHSRITGHDNIFSFSHRKEGLFSITSAEYNYNDRNYSLGCAVYYGVCCGENYGIETSAPQASKKKISVAPWINIEHPISSRCSLLGQASIASGPIDCRYYLGIGSTYNIGCVKFGLFADYAKFEDGNEVVTELTCRLPVCKIVNLQPTVEVITTNKNVSIAGLMRMSLSL